MPSTIVSGSLLTVRVVKGEKTLYYSWWVYFRADIKLGALSVASNVVESAKLIAFADSWAFAGELDSKYYKFPVTVTYSDPNNVKLASLSIGGRAVTDSELGTPDVKGAAEIGPAQNGGSVIGAVPQEAAGSTIKYALAVQGAEPAEEDWKEVTSVSSPWGPPTVTYPSFTFNNNDELWVKVADGTQTVKTYKIVITLKTWAATDAVLDSLAINGDFNFMDYSYGYIVSVTDFGTLNTAVESVVAGSFAVEEGKQGLPAYGVTGLYVNAVSNSSAAIHFAKSVTAPTEEADWIPSTGANGPASFEFINNDTFWVRVTAGTFVNYYKFTVTVTPAASA